MPSNAGVCKDVTFRWRGAAAAAASSPVRGRLLEIGWGRELPPVGIRYSGLVAAGETAGKMSPGAELGFYSRWPELPK